MAKCSACDQVAVLHVPYSGRYLCRAHFLRFFDRRVKAEIAKQGRIEPGRLAVALSGGKDSVALLHALHSIVGQRPDVELHAISIDEGIAGYRDSALEICRELTTSLGVAWHLVPLQDLAGYTIDAFAAKEDASGSPRVACGPCGVFRRQGLNDKAAELGATAIATGHNLDDMAQTVLMNVLKGDADRLGRLAPHDQVQPGMVRRIIPFREIPEKEVLLYTLLNDLPLHMEEECPYAERAHRFQIRDTLLELEAQSPGTRHSLMRFQDRLRELAPERQTTAGTCATCGGPTSGTVCKACQWRSAH